MRRSPLSPAGQKAEHHCGDAYQRNDGQPSRGAGVENRSNLNGKAWLGHGSSFHGQPIYSMPMTSRTIFCALGRSLSANPPNRVRKKKVVDLPESHIFHRQENIP
jgi:hypothetical protein